jgi:hypothetical protein
MCNRVIAYCSLEDWVTRGKGPTIPFARYTRCQNLQCDQPLQPFFIHWAPNNELHIVGRGKRFPFARFEKWWSMCTEKSHFAICNKIQLASVSHFWQAEGSVSHLFAR